MHVLYLRHISSQSINWSCNEWLTTDSQLARCKAAVLLTTTTTTSTSAAVLSPCWKRICFPNAPPFQLSLALPLVLGLPHHRHGNTCTSRTVAVPAALLFSDAYG